MKRSISPLAMLLLAAPLVLAAPASRPLWNITVDGPSDRELRQSFVTPVGNAWMLSSLKDEGIAGPATAVELVGVDTAGRPIARHELPTVVAERTVSQFSEVAVLKDGTVVVFATATSGELLAMTVETRTGRVTRTMVVGTSRREHFVSSVVAAEEGRLLLVGRSGDRAWMAKIDQKLGIRWEKTYEEQPVTVLHDAVVGDDGSIATVGAQLLPNGSTNLWVATMTNEGQVVETRSFAGREAKIARQADGSLAIVHDVKGPAGWDVYARGFSTALGEEWATLVADALRIPTPYSITDAPRGAWFVAGPDEGLLTVTGLASNGVVASTYIQPKESAVWERLWNVGDLLVVDSDLIVPFTLLTVGEDQRQRQQLRLMKLPVTVR